MPNEMQNQAVQTAEGPTQTPDAAKAAASTQASQTPPDTTAATAAAAQAKQGAPEQTETPENDLTGGGEEKNAASDKTPDGGQKPGGGKEEPEKVQTQAPEEDPYGDFDLPEGITMAEEPMRKFKELAKELNLPKDAAQKLVDLQTGMVASQVQEYQAVQGNWKAEVEKEYGVKTPEALSRAAKAMDAFGGPQLREALEELGLGNHPALVRAFAKIGESISEDKLVSSKTQSGGDKTFAEALYGKK